MNVNTLHRAGVDLSTGLCSLKPLINRVIVKCDIEMGFVIAFRSWFVDHICCSSNSLDVHSSLCNMQLYLFLDFT